MKELDRMKFTLLMGEMCVAFQVEPTDELMEVYWKHLAASVSITGFEETVNYNIKNSDRFPTISKLLQEPENCELIESPEIKARRRLHMEKYQDDREN